MSVDSSEMGSKLDFTASFAALAGFCEIEVLVASGNEPTALLARVL